MTKAANMQFVKALKEELDCFDTLEWVERWKEWRLTWENGNEIHIDVTLRTLRVVIDHEDACIGSGSVLHVNGSLIELTDEEGYLDLQGNYTGRGWCDRLVADVMALRNSIISHSDCIHQALFPPEPKPEPDPRDALIAQLELALAECLDQLNESLASDKCSPLLEEEKWTKESMIEAAEQMARTEPEQNHSPFNGVFDGLLNKGEPVHE